MKARIIGAIALAAIALTAASCQTFTETLWEATAPSERVFISSADITEAELQHRGVAYEPYRGSDRDGYLVEKSRLHKLRDYTFRALGTPVTVVLDTAVVVTITGECTLQDAAIRAVIHHAR